MFGYDRHKHKITAKISNFKETAISIYPIDAIEEDSFNGRRYGFISPRYSNTVISNKLPKKRGIPNLHGWYSEGLANSKIYLNSY